MSDRGDAGATRIVVFTAASVITIIGVHLGAGLISPLLLALVLVITVHPVRHALEARRMPPWLATAAVIAIAWAVLLAIVVLTVAAGGLFVRVVEDHAPELGAGRDAIRSVTDALGYPRVTGDAVSEWLDPRAIVEVTAGIAGELATVVLAFAFVLVYVLYLAVDAPIIDGAVERFRSTRAALVDAFTSYAGSVRRYYVINTVFGAVVALLDGVLLWAAGVPGVFAWAVLAFITNYIPSVGFIIGLVPPTVLAFAVGGWQSGLVVLIGYCAINVGLQVFVQPRFVSQAVRLNLTLTFFSVVFWTAVLGPIGAVLAIPMTLLVRTVLLRSSLGAHPLGRWLTGDPPPEDPLRS
ncbi:AI-2E family transporter [Herbiconiux sp. VKM Ac-2851]|uniref:AI-2E family transporter n=1 Tax=Herbiconiux sp. VKM Ac-2851 TaxID=2739025 RepID=UPI001564E6D0|nr:AI-2E family transporter [Herbiconiux sp. VKM Ac-2851]